MRIIEPQQFKGKNIKVLADSNRRKFSFFKGKKLFGVIFVIVLALVGVWQFWTQDYLKETSQTSELKSPAAQTPEATNQGPKKLKIFTPEEFRGLFETTAYPNSTPITSPPVITGNTAADERIRKVAEARGYRLRSIPQSPIVKVGDSNLDEDDLLQQKALDAWHNLKAIAKDGKIPLQILSAYRSPELQRAIFNSRLQAYGVTYAQVAAGQADAQVDELLQSTSIPGYSRHHTGYTIDLQCGNDSLEAFEGSICHSWINQNNYENAKKTGWIPSYPEGVKVQGPEPEPWEFVWVGTEVLYE